MAFSRHIVGSTHIVTHADSPLGIPRRRPEMDAQAAPADLRIHDLRHSFASHAAAGGISLIAIGGLLGHKSPQTTSRYIDWADDPLREASSRVASRISAAMETAVPEGSDNVRSLSR